MITCMPPNVKFCILLFKMDSSTNFNCAQNNSWGVWNDFFGHSCTLDGEKMNLAGEMTKTVAELKGNQVPDESADKVFASVPHESSEKTLSAQPSNSQIMREKDSSNSIDMAALLLNPLTFYRDLKTKEPEARKQFEYFHGQSWTAWSESVGLNISCVQTGYTNSIPESQASNLNETHNSNSNSEHYVFDVFNNDDCNKLNAKDMHLYGICPEIFPAATYSCCVCSSGVKAVGLRDHFERWHIVSSEELITPMEPVTKKACNRKIGARATKRRRPAAKPKPKSNIQIKRSISTCTTTDNLKEEEYFSCFGISDTALSLSTLNTTCPSVLSVCVQADVELASTVIDIKSKDVNVSLSSSPVHIKTEIIQAIEDVKTEMVEVIDSIKTETLEVVHNEKTDIMEVVNCEKTEMLEVVNRVETEMFEEVDSVKTQEFEEVGNNVKTEVFEVVDNDSIPYSSTLVFDSSYKGKFSTAASEYSPLPPPTDMSQITTSLSDHISEKPMSAEEIEFMSKFRPLAPVKDLPSDQSVSSLLFPPSSNLVEPLPISSEFHIIPSLNEAVGPKCVQVATQTNNGATASTAATNFHLITSNIENPHTVTSALKILTPISQNQTVSSISTQSIQLLAPINPCSLVSSTNTSLMSSSFPIIGPLTHNQPLQPSSNFQLLTPVNLNINNSSASSLSYKILTPVTQAAVGSPAVSASFHLLTPIDPRLSRPPSTFISNLQPITRNVETILGSSELISNFQPLISIVGRTPLTSTVTPDIQLLTPLVEGTSEISTITSDFHPLASIVECASEPLPLTSVLEYPNESSSLMSNIQSEAPLVENICTSTDDASAYPSYTFITDNTSGSLSLTPFTPMMDTSELPPQHFAPFIDNQVESNTITPETNVFDSVSRDSSSAACQTSTEILNQFTNDVSDTELDISFNSSQNSTTPIELPLANNHTEENMLPQWEMETEMLPSAPLSMVQEKCSDSSSSSSSSSPKKILFHFDKHCGIRDNITRKRCMNSVISCNIHSLEERRSVQGRTVDFDHLLNEYEQFKNQEDALDFINLEQDIFNSGSTSSHVSVDDICNGALNSTVENRFESSLNNTATAQTGLVDPCSRTLSAEEKIELLGLHVARVPDDLDVHSFIPYPPRPIAGPLPYKSPERWQTMNLYRGFEELAQRVRTLQRRNHHVNNTLPNRINNTVRNNSHHEPANLRRVVQPRYKTKYILSSDKKSYHKITYLPHLRVFNRSTELLAEELKRNPNFDLYAVDYDSDQISHTNPKTSGHVGKAHNNSESTSKTLPGNGEDKPSYAKNFKEPVNGESSRSSGRQYENRVQKLKASKIDLHSNKYVNVTSSDDDSTSGSECESKSDSASNSSSDDNLPSTCREGECSRNQCTMKPANIKMEVEDIKIEVDEWELPPNFDTASDGLLELRLPDSNHVINNGICEHVGMEFQINENFDRDRNGKDFSRNSSAKVEGCDTTSVPLILKTSNRPISMTKALPVKRSSRKLLPESS